MQFDLFLGESAIGGHMVPVRMRCARCGTETQSQVRNSAWNDLKCSRCCATSRQFVTASHTTVDALTRQIGQTTVWQFDFDWRKLGLWIVFLGPREERRVPLVFEVARRGLAGTALRLSFAARRAGDQQVIFAGQKSWTMCNCVHLPCGHNRFTWWLPPTGIWDQEELVCETRVTTEDGAILFDDRVRFDISPPQITEPRASHDVSESETPTVETPGTNIVDEFHRLFYYGAEGEHHPWARTYWLNVPHLQCAFDAWVFQEILSEVKPDLVIETGTLFGGNALFLAHMMDLLGHGEVISIDIAYVPRVDHPRVRYVTGSSTDAVLVRRLLAGRPDEKRLVLLDSDHSKAHVLAEMELYAPYVTPGSYLIVTDSNINGHPVYPHFGPGPYEAIEEFLSHTDEFVIDRSREKFKLTFNPNGYLKRVKRAGAAGVE
ncbi:MAG: CmcI family methyltransferase [Gemmataceae bacterium]